MGDDFLYQITSLLYSHQKLQYFFHENPHLNHCFYRGLWILPWGTKIYAPSIQHKMEYRAAHILGKTFNIYFLSVYFPKLLSNLWQCQGRSSMMWSCCWNIWSIGMALFIVVLDNQTSIWYFFNAITMVANGHVLKMKLYMINLVSWIY